MLSVRTLFQRPAFIGIACGLAFLPLAASSYLVFSGSANSEPEQSGGTPRPKHMGQKSVAQAAAAAAANRQADYQSVDHARAASIQACLPAVAELSRMTVDAPHIALSTWNKADADGRLFESVVGLKYDNEVAPHGLSVLMASPNADHKCDGSTVQVQPSALSCEAIEKNRTRESRRATDLNGVAVIQSNPSLRLLLMPTVGNGCTVVGVGVYYAN